MLQFIQPAYNAIVKAVKASYHRAAVIVGMLFFRATIILASSTGAGGFTRATTEISSYQTPVANLMKAIAAVIVLVGAFNVYFKMQNGDQDVKKTIMFALISLKFTSSNKLTLKTYKHVYQYLINLIGFKIKLLKLNNITII